MGSVERRVDAIGNGVYRVDAGDGRGQLVYVAGPLHDRWVFWNGRVYRGDFSDTTRASRRGQRGRAAQAVAAPMPATVLKVLVSAGQAVKKGDTVVVLEAMKMELPIRASGDGTVRAIRCREGELVQADATLVEFE